MPAKPLSAIQYLLLVYHLRHPVLHCLFLRLAPNQPITVGDFAIAGSFVLFFIALEMILGIKIYKDEVASAASVVPLAFPLIAGTGTLTTLLSIRAEYNLLSIIIAIILNVIIVYFVLRYLTLLEKLLGVGGIAIVKKVFGIVLLALAIKLFRKYTGL